MKAKPFVFLIFFLVISLPTSLFASLIQIGDGVLFHSETGKYWYKNMDSLVSMTYQEQINYISALPPIDGIDGQWVMADDTDFTSLWIGNSFSDISGNFNYTYQYGSGYPTEWDKIWFGRLDVVTTTDSHKYYWLKLLDDGTFIDNTGEMADSYVDFGVGAWVTYDLFTEPDSDGDGIPDSDDQCPETSSGYAVDSTGCSIAQLCPVCPADPWKNHGKYVSCAAQEAELFYEEGLISEEEKDAIVSEAAQSDVGKKGKDTCGEPPPE